VRYVRLIGFSEDGAIIADPEQHVRGFTTLLNAPTLALIDNQRGVAIIIDGVIALRHYRCMLWAECVVLPDEGDDASVPGTRTGSGP
jgi:hypothetical protein